MITEPITGISFRPPEPGVAASAELGISILEDIAVYSANHLQQGGYLADTEVQDVLSTYRAFLEDLADAPSDSWDFLIFLAQRQARKYSVNAEGEVRRMHRLLHSILHESVNYWSKGLGTMPGRAHSFYDQCPSLRVACALLFSHAVFATESCIIHVVAINPVAGLVAAEWIRHEVALLPGREEPYVFPFMLEFRAWEAMQTSHF